MKLALIGKGKTGREVIKHLAREELPFIYDTQHPLKKAEARNVDAIIVFVPGEAFLNLLPELLELRKPIVVGSTGFSWPHYIETELQKRELAWVHGANFSMSMNMMFYLTRQIMQWSSWLFKPSFHIHEIHHIHKKDTPSGTARTLAKNINPAYPLDISSERLGECVGVHTLTIETPQEALSIKHEAKDRSIYAQGAIWAARHLIAHRFSPGLHFFDKIMADLLASGQNI